MNTADKQLGFRKAYVCRPKPIGRDSVTPPHDIEPSVLRIATRWNEKIPINRVRILTTARFELVRVALAIFDSETILATINHYASLPWQRRKKAWKKFDRFFEIATIVEKVEEHLQATEKTEQRKPPVNPLVRKLQQQIFNKQADMTKWDALQKQFEGLDPARRREMLKAADAELRRLCGPQTNISPRRRLRHALVILNRENETK